MTIHPKRPRIRNDNVVLRTNTTKKQKTIKPKLSKTKPTLPTNTQKRQKRSSSTRIEFDDDDDDDDDDMDLDEVEADDDISTLEESTMGTTPGQDALMKLLSLARSASPKTT
jgi:hypothetical protein